MTLEELAQQVCRVCCGPSNSYHIILKPQEHVSMYTVVLEMHYQRAISATCENSLLVDDEHIPIQVHGLCSVEDLRDFDYGVTSVSLEFVHRLTNAHIAFGQLLIYYHDAFASHEMNLILLYALIRQVLS